MTGPAMRALSRAQVREIDRRAIAELGIPGVVLMENAGRGAAERIQAAYGGAAAGRHVIACGGGNNGGDGFVVARHLVNAGVDVLVLLAADAARLPADAAVNHGIAVRMGIAMLAVTGAGDVSAAVPEVQRAGVVVDALLGTGFAGEVRSPISELILAINTGATGHVVALDVPSGLDCDTGAAAAATVRAEMTVTFVAPKIGFANPGAAAWLGRVVVADIGAPKSLWPPG